jgi:O-antigen/teichoic acid export membrane protein
VFKVSALLKETAVRVIRIYGTASIIFSFISPVFTASLSSNHRFDIINGVQITGGMVSSLLLFVVIPKAGNALYGWVGVMLTYQIVNFALYMVFFKRFCQGARLGVTLINPKRLRPLFQLGGYMYVLQLTNALAERLDPLVISFFLGPSGVALYKAGARINELIRPAVLSLADQVHPLTTQYHVRDQKSHQHRLLIDGTRYTLYLGAICSVGIILFAESFTRLWLFDSLGESCRTVARVMQLWALASLATYSGAMHWPLVLGMKKLPFALVLQIPSAIINATLSIYFVGYTQAGIPGVLYATVLTEVLRRPFAVWYAAKITHTNLSYYLKHGYGMAVLYILLLSVPGYLVFRNMVVSGWIQFGLAAGLFIVYALTMLCIVERELVANLIKLARSRMR